MVGWNIRPRQLVARFLLKISVLSCIELFTCVISVNEICVIENDLYVVVMNDLVVSHVDYYHASNA
jgi:hypothetical protein